MKLIALLVALLAGTSFAQTVTDLAGPAPSPPPTPASAPAAKVSWVYHKGVLRWPGDWSWEAKINYKDKDGIPLEGKYDIAVTITSGTGGWQPYINSSCQSKELCFDTAPFKYLIFSLKATSAKQTWAAHMESSGDVPDGTVADISAYGPPLVVGEWGSYKIPLSAFGMTNATILKFSIQSQSGPGVFYVDDVGFSTRAE